MNRLNMHSPDLTQEQLRRLMELFPHCVSEVRDPAGELTLAVDFDLLRQTLSEHLVEGPAERYRIEWPGKREALLTANTPIARTLRPQRAQSVDFATTRHLFIEGDNLDALKLLRDTYLGAVKIIYIDPPYNTGNDYIYRDNYSLGARDYALRAAERDAAGNRLTANSRSNGRFHSDWLSMIYPRLLLARQLLADDGVILISLDDNEQPNARRLCDEIFGEQAFVGVFSWRARTAKADVPYGVSNDVEWVLAYAKPGFIAGRPGERKYYRTDDYADRWRLHDLTKNTTRGERPNSYFTMVNPRNGDEYPASEVRTWAVTQETFMDYYRRGKIVFPGDYDFLNITRPAFRVFESEDQAKARARYGSDAPKMSISTYLPAETVGRTEHGSREVRELFGAQVFSYPKPTSLIRHFLENIDDRDATVMDFFSGSGTTAHAVLAQNAQDGGRRRFIVVQLPEVLDRQQSSQATAYDFCRINGIEPNLAALARERIRRAGQRIRAGEHHPEWDGDVGFRTLTVDSSNMKGVYYRPAELTQQSLLDLVDNVKDDRSDEDLLFQVMLDLGVDLTLPIERVRVKREDFFTRHPTPDTRHPTRPGRPSRSSRWAETRCWPVLRGQSVKN